MKAHSLTKCTCGSTEVRVFSVYPFGLPLQGTFIFYHLHLSISSFILQSYGITAKIRGKEIRAPAKKLFLWSSELLKSSTYPWFNTFSKVKLFTRMVKWLVMSFAKMKRKERQIDLSIRRLRQNSRIGFFIFIIFYSVAGHQVLQGFLCWPKHTQMWVFFPRNM